ncbi:MAG: response regulator transcription factor [Candidatus Krumholzibacteriota bacterium]|nr:response regulator transcription factor [Candidatus Krumholzibacteriota bacterium]
MAKIRILLIEDNRLLREGIAAMLESQSDFQVIARSEDGNVLNQLKTTDSLPDVILLDLGLEKADSLGLMKTLIAEVPTAKLIAMDIFPEQLDIVEFVKAGGSGFILKSATPEDYIDTIRAVLAGSKVLPPGLTNSLFAQIVESALKTGTHFSDNSIKLTSRERDVIALIYEGMSNKEIAESLHIATYTVKSHVHNILEKLSLNTRLQIAAYPRKDRP